MRRTSKSLSGLLLLMLLAVLSFLIYGNMQFAKDYSGSDTETISDDEIRTSPGENIDIKIAVCGDIVAHTGLNAEALQPDGSFDYKQIMEGAASVVESADLALVTLETTFPKTTDYTGYPLFKSPSDLAKSLADLGFDLINTANNHSVDSYQSGLIRTLDILDENGLDHVGTYRTQEERDKNHGVVVKEVDGITIAFLSYTYGTNGLPVTGFEYAINVFFKDYMSSQADIDYDLLRADMKYARSLNTDIIIPFMHWGYEYHRMPNAYQEELAEFLFAEGADIILGGHVHVPQPMELRRVTDNEGNEKTVFIAYCLGNFISSQNDLYTNLTAMLELTISKDSNTGETTLKHVSYKPLFMVDLGDYEIPYEEWRYRLWDLHGAITAYDSGDNKGVIHQGMYNTMKEDLDRLHTVMDPEFDEINGGVDVEKWTLENS
jgi:Putative enzyme of poly-gamma-glutamate biosynthesis (capsule formation)